MCVCVCGKRKAELTVTSLTFLHLLHLEQHANGIVMTAAVLVMECVKCCTPRTLSPKEWAEQQSRKGIRRVVSLACDPGSKRCIGDR